MQTLTRLLAALLVVLGIAAGSRAQTAPDKSERAWFVAVDGQQQGPMTAGDVEKLIKAGKAKPESLVWREGRADWVPLQETKEFRAFFVKPPPLPAAPAPTPPPLPAATGAPPPLPGASAPAPSRTILGAPAAVPEDEPPPDPATDAPPARRAPAKRSAADTRADEIKLQRNVVKARERADVASSGVRNTALLWGGTTVGLAGAGTVALLFGSTTQDASLRPACTVLGCGLCVACGGTLITGGVLTGLGVSEMVDADRDLEQAQQDARGMRY